ncbi:hypothetical protein B1C78_07055 [Thioalkalivibrio denitrificans]|uniref:Lcl C-terminal domain-containing protein n=1 Tax=Thioalkalivibrio denitrificans TaxID=108003 RepID=A0A1V3NJU3_9GAMM|nr:DUF1566 domain-containing protein [Thioalkalivibrio denitrificans]OOG25168.1 hypothetical protein B1C78_07055 [Thioalkalivibrio denitrificans]
MKRPNLTRCGRPAVTVCAVLLLAGCGQSQPIEFLFEPVGSDGEEYTGGGSFSRDPWQCVRDLRTSLVWEVKTREPGLHHADHTYTWHFSDDSGVYNRGDPGRQDGGECTGSACDTQAYVEAVNEQGLCGHHDWRLPTKEELGSLVDPRIRPPGPTLDIRYFPHMKSAEYWTSTTYAYHAPTAWVWGFEHGLDRVDYKHEPKHIMLVRGEVELKDLPKSPRQRR